MRLRALFSEIDDRKCVVLSVVGVDGAQAMYAIFGRRCWYRWRMWEVVLMEGVKRSHIDWCSLTRVAGIHEPWSSSSPQTCDDAREAAR